MKELVPWLWIAAIAVVFWLLIIRPASKRQKEVMSLQASLKPGDDVVLTSGVFATVVALADDHLEVEVAPGVVLRVVRQAVGSVRRDEAVTHEAAAEADETAPADGERADGPDENEER